MEDEERIPNAISVLKLEGDSTERPDVKVKHEQSSASTTPSDSKTTSRSPSMANGKTEGDGDSKQSLEPTPKLSRRQSAKTPNRSTRLYDHLPNVTEESCSHFQVISDCLYGSKHMGSSDHDALDCDCSEEWRKLSRWYTGARVIANANSAQRMARTTLVARTLTVSTGRPRWNVSTATAIAELDARIRGSSENSLLTCLS